MVIRHFEYLVALARERHFARAAAVCHVTQPALSAGLKHLEECFGVVIVQRGHRFHGFTTEGERILAWARHLLAERDALSQELSAMRQGLTGHLRIGGIPVALPVLPLVTTPFALRHPGMRLTITSLTSREIQRGLDECSLDVGLTYLDSEPLVHVRATPIYREHYIVLTPADGPFAGRDSITWAEAADLKLCLLTQTMQNRRIIDSYFLGAGVTVDPVVETNSLVTLVSHLRRGSWSTILPHTIRYLIGEGHGLSVLPLVEPSGTHEVGLIVPAREPVAPAAAALIAEAMALDVEAELQDLLIDSVAPASIIAG
jgi:DNA-binding transcriptional LysR family regulator